MKNLLLILFFLFSTFQLHARRLAIVIGCGNYPLSTGLPVLVADRDTYLMAEALKRSGWEVIFFNANSNLQKPTSKNILNVLGLEQDSLSKKYTFSTLPQHLLNLSAEDEILFFFGGHGVTSVEGSDCIVPYDAIFRLDTCITPQRLIPLERIKQALNRTEALVIMAVDACRAEFSVRNQNNTTLTPKFSPSIIDSDSIVFSVEKPGAKSPKCLMIKSTSPGAYAHENQKAGEGVFNYFFRRLLTDAEEQELADIAPADGIISLGEAFNHLKKETYEYVAALAYPMKKSEQIPYENWEGPLSKEHPFLFIETKVLSKPNNRFTISTQSHSDLPPQAFRQEVEENPAFQNERFFQITPNVLIETLPDGTVIEESEIAPDFSPSANPFQSYYGIMDFPFYFPNSILNELLKHKKYSLKFENIPYQAHRNFPISGTCVYKLAKDTLVEIDYNQQTKSLKVWKITQSVDANHKDTCSPYKVRIFRTFFVFQNSSDPVILEMVAYRHCYINANDIASEERSFCVEIPGKVEYQHKQIIKIYP